MRGNILQVLVHGSDDLGIVFLQRSGKGGLNREQFSGGPDEVSCRTMMMHSLEVSGKLGYHPQTLLSFIPKALRVA